MVSAQNFTIGLRGEAVGGSIRFVARGGVTGIVWVENGGRYVDVEGRVWVWTGGGYTDVAGTGIVWVGTVGGYIHVGCPGVEWAGSGCGIEGGGSEDGYTGYP